MSGSEDDYFQFDYSLPGLTGKSLNCTTRKSNGKVSRFIQGTILCAYFNRSGRTLHESIRRPVVPTTYLYADLFQLSVKMGPLQAAFLCNSGDVVIFQG